MVHNPRAGFRDLLVEALTTDDHGSDEEVRQIAAQAGAYLDVDDVGGPHFELLNITLEWNALCRALVEGEVALSGRFAGLPLVGVLRWFDSMRYYYQFNANWQYPHRDDLAIDPVEAATCMALWQQEAEAQPYSPGETVEALLERVNDILGETAFDSIDKPRLQDALDRLKTLRCLTARAGWYRLREEMKFQIPEE